LNIILFNRGIKFILFLLLDGISSQPLWCIKRCF